jgi:hypothetical protein
LLHNHTLESVSSAKYLGITLQSDLKWTQHTNNIVANANKSLEFFKRNLKTSMISFVLSRRCCNVGQVRVCSISVTLLVLWYMLQAYLAARRWTISILLQPNTIIHWNLLPQTIVLCPTVNTFREQLTPTVLNHLQSQI